MNKKKFILTPLQRSSWCILQPQLTGQYNVAEVCNNTEEVIEDLEFSAPLQLLSADIRLSTSIRGRDMYPG